MVESFLQRKAYQIIAIMDSRGSNTTASYMPILIWIPTIVDNRRMCTVIVSKIDYEFFHGNNKVMQMNFNVLSRKIKFVHNDINFEYFFLKTLVWYYSQKGHHIYLGDLTVHNDVILQFQWLIFNRKFFGK
jgi:hypothetical protein